MYGWVIWFCSANFLCLAPCVCVCVFVCVCVCVLQINSGNNNLFTLNLRPHSLWTISQPDLNADAVNPSFRFWGQFNFIPCIFIQPHIHITWAALNRSVLIQLLRWNIVTNLYLSSPCLENWPSQRSVHHQCTARPVMLHLKLITLWTPTDKLSWLRILLST